jgi:FxLD family lantipeptide
VTIQAMEGAVAPAAGDDSLATAGIEDLDITFVEAGDSVVRLIRMTNDNCGTTCESACTSC